MSCILDKYKTDNLFLLIGTNPLPNYVAALLLTNDNGKIYLLHSDGSDDAPSTKPFATQLKISLENKMKSVKAILYGINESSSSKIKEKIDEIMDNEEISGSIGLNYTGGTKPMAVHVYRTLSSRYGKAVYSYLDSRKLALRFDECNAIFPVAKEVEISLKELAALHNYHFITDPIKEIKSKELVQSLAEIHSKKESFEAWRKWLEEFKGENSDPRLPDLIEYPALKPFIDAINRTFGGQSNVTPEKVSNKIGHQKIKSCSKWLIADWLEELVLDAVLDIRQEVGICDLGRSVHPESKILNAYVNFDLDVAAMIGYQLFAISCIVSEKIKTPKEEIKKHLFEVYIRARQLGGDEARIALVCCLDNPEILEAEVVRDWHAKGQIRVFGRKHLTDLSNQMRIWFKTCCK